jgi:hypothetical protein
LPFQTLEADENRGAVRCFFFVKNTRCTIHFVGGTAIAADITMCSKKPLQWEGGGLEDAFTDTAVINVLAEFREHNEVVV